MGTDNKLDNKIESFDKYRENLFSIARKIITNISKSKENNKKFEESFINEIFFPYKLTTVDQKLSPQDIFFGVLFYGFNEICISFERLKDLEVYNSRFPNTKTPIAKINYLVFLIENYLSETYILKERLNKYSKKIRESYIEDKRYVSIRKTCDQLISTVEDILKNITTLRGSHTHVVRYSDGDIKRLESLFLYKEILDKLQKYLPDYIVPNFKIEYRKLRSKWKKTFEDNNKQIKIMLDYYFKKMLKIVFINDGEISYPEKHNSIENRKKFFSKG
ncbi:MAG: hypothetical protein IBV53_08160 [Candidatus Atribacteria bacterium]